MVEQDSFLSRISDEAHPLLTLAVGLGLLWAVHGLDAWIKKETLGLKKETENIRKLEDQASQDLNELRALRDFKERDVAKLKSGFLSLARSKKLFVESGLSLQEEKRLLEKLLEIMTTSLRVDSGTKKISLMRQDHSLEDFSIQYPPPKSFGPNLKPLPANIKITSKERFAHPERGKSEEVNGTLAWNPPQVGTSVRSNALGEYVMFTNSDLILHGPPKKASEHEAFPHLCLGISLESARKLYKSSFIGTRITLKSPSP